MFLLRINLRLPYIENPAFTSAYEPLKPIILHQSAINVSRAFFTSTFSRLTYVESKMFHTCTQMFPNAEMTSSTLSQLRICTAYGSGSRWLESAPTGSDSKAIPCHALLFPGRPFTYTPSTAHRRDGGLKHPTTVHQGYDTPCVPVSMNILHSSLWLPNRPRGVFPDLSGAISITVL